VGEKKSGRVTLEAIRGCLAAESLLFNQELLGDMFGEADFRHQGSLTPQDVLDAVTG
jgi:hypothetical protein